LNLGLNLGVVIAYLLGVTLFGLRFRTDERSVRTYFLGRDTVPWWALSLSIVAAETSTLTLISIPGLSYQTDFGFLQLVLGYLVGRVLICLILLPRFYQGEIMTAYEWILSRFGLKLQRLTAGVFLLARAGAEGVRVYAVSIVVSAFLGLQSTLGGDALAIGLVILLTLLYTYHGGLTAVIWTDVIQMGVYVLGTWVALYWILHSLPAGWSDVQVAAAAGAKFQVFHFDWTFSKPYTFWAGLIGGTFITLSTHGTDQLLVQRLLAARSEVKARYALLSSGVVILIQFAFYLMIGVGLFTFYRFHGGAPEKPDRIFPQFIVSELPVGISGLLIAAILAAAMSNLSAALNSLSSTSVVDFISKLKPSLGEKERLQISRQATVVWGLVLFFLAIVSRGGGRVVETGLAVTSVAYGSVLGVFLAGALTSHIRERAALIGMIVGALLNIVVWLTQVRSIAFPWFVPMGSITTLLVAIIIQRHDKIDS
jgi:SSS family transporter